MAPSAPWGRWCSTVCSHLPHSQMTGHGCGTNLCGTKPCGTPGCPDTACQRGFARGIPHIPPRPYPVFAVAFNRVSARPSCSRSTRPLFLTDDKCCSGRSGTARVPPACGSIQQLMEVQTPALPSACLHRRSCARRHKHMAVIPEG